MTKDEFIQEYSRFGHRTDVTYESHHAGVPFARWNLDKVHQHFDAVPCDCGHQECKGWKMRAKSMDPPEDCSLDPMTLFGPLGPPFTMMDPEQPSISFTSSDDEIQPIDKWKCLADVKPEWGQLVEYRGESWRKEPDKTYSAIDATPRRGKFVKDCGTHWTEDLNGFTTEKLGVIVAPDPEITFWRAVIDWDKGTAIGSDHCMPIPAFEFGEPNTGLAASTPEPLTIGLDKPDEFRLSFIQDGEAVGNLWINPETMQLEFKGDADASALLFVDYVAKHFKQWFDDNYDT